MTELLDQFVRTGTWLDEQEFPALRWAVPGLMPEGFGLIVGGPKRGKSWFVLDCGLAIATGRNALGGIHTGAARPVLYLALEDGHRRLQDRARKILGDHPIPGMFHFVIRVSPDLVLPVIGDWLTAYGDQAPLVILDTLGKVMPTALPGEGAYQRDYRIGGRLKEIADAYPGTTVGVVHHDSKQARDDWMESTSGTNGLNGSADWTLNLARPRNEADGLLRITGRDVAEGEYAVTFEGHRWVLVGGSLPAAAEAATQRQLTEGISDRSAEILKTLAQHPDGIGPTALAAAHGMKAPEAGTYLGRLVDSGRARKVGRGLYTCVESVERVEMPGQGTLGVSTPAETSVETPNPPARPDGQGALGVSTPVETCGNDDGPLTRHFHTSTLSTQVGSTDDEDTEGRTEGREERRNQFPAPFAPFALPSTPEALDDPLDDPLDDVSTSAASAALSASQGKECRQCGSPLNSLRAEYFDDCPDCHRREALGA